MKSNPPSRGVGIRNISDYSPFGVILQERTVESAFFRYGFQGQEGDSEIKGEGNSVNYKYRMHDPRIGRFFAVDPLAAKYPFYSPYAFSGNRVIDCIELEGLEPAKAEGWSTEKPEGESEVQFWQNEKGGMTTYYRGIQQLQEVKVTPNEQSSGSLIIQESDKSSDPLAGVNLSSVESGMTTPLSQMANPWKDDILNHPEWQLTRNKCANLEVAVVANLSLPGLLIGGAAAAPTFGEGLSLYHSTIGVNGGYANMGLNWLNQSYTQGGSISDYFSFDGKSITGILTAGAFTSLGGQVAAGVSDPWMNITYTNNEGLYSNGFLFNNRKDRPTLQKTTALSIIGTFGPLYQQSPLFKSNGLNFVLEQGLMAPAQKAITNEE